MTQVCGFFVLDVEYERGWGQRPDGYRIFNSEAEADAFIKAAYADRVGYAPDYYINYEKVGWKPISDIEQAKLRMNGVAYRN